MLLASVQVSCLLCDGNMHFFEKYVNPSTGILIPRLAGTSCLTPGSESRMSETENKSDSREQDSVQLVVSRNWVLEGIVYSWSCKRQEVVWIR